MTEARPSFFARLFLAFVAYWRVLLDPELAARVTRLLRGALPPAEPAPAAAEPEPEPPPALEQAPPAGAHQLLGILQREGRFVDFLQEDVSSFSDADIGAAARVVHDGCKKALDEHFTLEPVRGEEEGSAVSVEQDFDASAVRLTGNVVGEPPFEGTLQHRGWRVTETRLPELAKDHDVSVVAPAEVEL